MNERLTGKIEALRQACGLYSQLVNPDPGKIVETARTFEAYLTEGDNGSAAPIKRGPGRPPKPRITDEGQPAPA